MSAKLLPAQEYLIECFSYTPETGRLTWKKRPQSHFSSPRGMNIFNAKHAGKTAGGVNSQGYLHVRLSNNELHRVHRVIWKLVTGADPANLIDHKDRLRTNNRWSNLREATDMQNTHNSSRVKGVYFHKASGKWHARIMAGGKTHSLKYHDTAEAAQEAYKAASVQYHGEFSSLNNNG